MQHVSREAKQWLGDKESPAKQRIWKAAQRFTRPFDFAVRKALATSLPLLKRNNGAIKLSRKDGWTITPPGRVPLTTEVVNACLDLFERRKSYLSEIRTAKDSKTKTYLYDVAGKAGFEEHLDLLHEYMTQDAILTPVMRYLGEFPVFQGVKLFWTPQNDSTISSQLWHLDSLDTAQVKFFLYLSDIDAAAGPTTLLSRSDSRRLAQTYNYVTGGRLSDEEVAAVIPRDHWIPLVGQKGTLATCDTSSCFHFGGRARARERLFLSFHYSSSAPFNLERVPQFVVKSWKDRMLLAI